MQAWEPLEHELTGRQSKEHYLSPSKCFNHFIQILAFIYGLDLAPEPARCLHVPSQCRNDRTLRRSLTLTMRIVTVANIGLNIAGRMVYDWFTLPNPASASDLFRIVYDINELVLMAVSALSLWLNEARVRSIFEMERVRHVYGIVFITWLICFIWFVQSDIYLCALYSHAKWAEQPLLDSLNAAGLWTRLHVKQIIFLAIIVYQQGQIVLKHRLKLIDWALAQSRQKKIVCGKKQARDITAALNETFGTLLTLLYLNIFALLYVGFVLGILESDNGLKSTGRSFFIGALLQMAILYQMASAGSEINKICKRSAFRTATIAVKELWNWEQQSYLKRYMAFDQELDSLMILDCFTHSRATLISYVGVLITCLGVLLQFDYRLMGRFDIYKTTVSSLKAAA